MISIDFSGCSTPMDMLSKYAREISPMNCYRDSNITLLTSLVNARFHLRLSHGTILGLLRVYRPVTGDPASGSSVGSIPRRFAQSSRLDIGRPDFFTITIPENAPPVSQQQPLTQHSAEPVPPASATAYTQGAPRYTAQSVRGWGGSQPGINKAQLQEPYATFARMREITETNKERENNSSSRNRLIRFIRQAAFMQDFEDNFHQAKALILYYNSCTYDHMDDTQLRTYFTWRTQTRKGAIRPISAAYVHCFVNEIINDIGVTSPKEAMDLLIAVWNACHEEVVGLSINMRVWIRDYYVLHAKDLDKDFSFYDKQFPDHYPISSHYPFNYHFHYQTVEQTIQKAYACPWSGLDVIELFSSHAITRGVFYQRSNQGAIQDCVCSVFRVLDEYFHSQGIDSKKLFFSESESYLPTLFPEALFDHDSLSVDEPYRVRISFFETIEFVDDDWVARTLSIGTYRAVIGYIVKSIEISMRKHFGFTSQLKAPKISTVENSFAASSQRRVPFTYARLSSQAEKFQLFSSPWKQQVLDLMKSDAFGQIIESTVSEYCSEHNIVVYISGTMSTEPPKPVEIDMDRLEQIRADHMETAAKLYTEDDGAFIDGAPGISVSPGAPAISASPGSPGASDASSTLGSPVAPATSASPASGSSPFHRLVSALTGNEREFLSSILHRRHSESIVAADGTNLELLIEAINEKSLDALQDNLIDGSSSLYSVYEEYADSLLAALEALSDPYPPAQDPTAQP